MRRLVSVLLVISAAAFAVGVAIERAHHVEPAAAHPASTTGEATGETASEATATPETSSETLAGINTESTALVGVAAVTSLVIAAALWVEPRRRPVLVAAFVVGATFAAFDLRETFHQSNLGNAGLVALALIVALLHLAVVATAGLALRPARDTLSA